MCVCVYIYPAPLLAPCHSVCLFLYVSKLCCLVLCLIYSVFLCWITFVWTVVDFLHWEGSAFCSGAASNCVCIWVLSHCWKRTSLYKLCNWALSEFACYDFQIFVVLWYITWYFLHWNVLIGQCICTLTDHHYGTSSFKHSFKCMY